LRSGSAAWSTARRSTGGAEQLDKLGVFHDALEQALKADARWPKSERRTDKALYVEIKAAGYAGG
jgi:hypothetical protein